jgi:hypothetical protein
VGASSPSAARAPSRSVEEEAIEIVMLIIAFIVATIMHFYGVITEGNR